MNWTRCWSRESEKKIMGIYQLSKSGPTLCRCTSIGHCYTTIGSSTFDTIWWSPTFSESQEPIGTKRATSVLPHMNSTSVIFSQKFISPTMQFKRDTQTTINMNLTTKFLMKSFNVISTLHFQQKNIILRNRYYHKWKRWALMLCVVYSQKFLQGTWWTISKYSD